MLGPTDSGPPHRLDSLQRKISRPSLLRSGRRQRRWLLPLLALSVVCRVSASPHREIARTARFGPELTESRGSFFLFFLFLLLFSLFLWIEFDRVIQEMQELTRKKEKGKHFVDVFYIFLGGRIVSLFVS